MPVAAGPVVEITTIAEQLDCQPLMMKRQGETKAAPRAADVDAGSCLLCGGLWGRGGVLFCVSVYECVFVCVGVRNTCTQILCVCVCVCKYCISVCIYVCHCCGPVATRNPAGRKSECIHPGSQGPGATQVPNEGMKGCSADVTRWGSAA